jgi:hypothetical protein
VISETLPEGRSWWRIAPADEADPLNPEHAIERGGRWSPPGSFPVLYLQEDVVSARIEMQRFADRWPFEPEDLIESGAPVLVEAFLPRQQTAADAHTPAGVKALGLPASYPYDRKGALVAPETLRPLGSRVRNQGVRGVRSRTASPSLGAGRALAWFPAGGRSTARRGRTLSFADWFWA